MTLAWLDVAADGGTDFTPIATADWRRAVGRLPADVACDARLDALHAAVDRWGERRGALRCDPLLDGGERARALAAIDAEAARSLATFAPLFRETPFLLQLAYVLAKQTQEEARLHFLPRALVRYGARLVDAEGDDGAQGLLRARLTATVGDLFERYEGLAMVAGELIHEGALARRRERAEAALDGAALAELHALGVERGLCDLEPDAEERGGRLRARRDRRLRRPPFDRPESRLAGRAAFDAGRGEGHERALDAFGRSLILLEALSRKVDLRRIDRLREALEDVDERGRRLVLRELARQLVAGGLAPAEAAARDPEEVALEALAAVLPKRGPRRRLAECLLAGDADGARATRLLLELKGLPFDRGAMVEALYRDAGCEGIARLEARFAAEHAATARDPRWLVVVKAGARQVARLRGEWAAAERLRPVRGPLPLERLLDRKLRPADRAAVERLRRGDRTGAELGLLERALAAGDVAGVVAALDLAGDGARGDLLARFAEGHGAPLASVLGGRLEPSALRDVAVALAYDDVRLARVARLRAAFAEAGATLEQAFDGLDAAGRARLVEDYDCTYAGASDGSDGTRLRGLFDVDLQRLVGTRTAALVGALVRHGGLPPEDLARYYMLGVGTNVGGLVELLRRMDRDAIAQLVARYDRKYRVEGARALRAKHAEPGLRERAIRAERERFGAASRVVDVPFVGAFYRRVALVNGLVGDLATELSGDAWFDVRDALLGRPEPERPHALARRLAERRAHEFSGRLVRSERFFRGLRRAVEASLASAERVFPEGAVDDDPAGSRRAPRLRYHLHARRAMLALDRFRAAKNRTGALLGDRLGGLGATLGALAGAAVERSLAGDVSLVTLALGGTVGAFLGKVVPKKLIAGDALGTEELGIDLAHAVVEGAGRMFSRLRRFGRFAVDGVQRGLGRTVFKVGAKRTLDQVSRGLASRLGARQDRLPELRVTSFRPREDLAPLSHGAALARTAVEGTALEHPDDAGLEAAFARVLGAFLRP